jgi:L-Ala-D/L-Glu epimerase
LRIEAKEEVWPLKEVFRISRGSRTEARVVVVTVNDGKNTGRGEGVPIARYNQSIDSVLAQIESIKSVRDLDRDKLQHLLPAGAARNALDCALWDLEAKRSGKRAWELANVPIVPEVETSFTISLDAPDKMATAAKAAANSPLLKLKLGGDDLDLARIEAVHKAAPTARLLIDANESWSPEHYRKIVPALKELGVELIEQPFPANADEVLKTLDHPVPICADETLRDGERKTGQNRRADGSAALDRACERKRVQIIVWLHGMHVFRNRARSLAGQRRRLDRS